MNLSIMIEVKLKRLYLLIWLYLGI